MQRFNKLRWLVYLVAGIGAIVLGSLWVQTLVKLDPFAKLRQLDTQPLGKQVAIRLEGVKMRQYEGAKLTASCTIGKIDIADNRQVLDFFSVTDGKYYAKKGGFSFETDKAQWNAARREVLFTGGARVSNKDVDLRAANFRYDQKEERLNIPGKVKGRFFDGNLVTNGLVYYAGKDSYMAGPSKWEGKLKNPLQEAGGQATKSKWKISFDDMNVKNGIQKGTNLYATDGEIIVRAEKGERDIKTDVITATGNVRYFSAKSDLIAEKAVIDRKAKKATLTGKVDMLIKPEDKQVLEEREIPPFQPVVPDAISKTRPPAPVADGDTEVSSTKNIRKYPVSVTATKVEYWYGKGSRRAIITGQPQAQQELTNGRWRYVWTVRAEYDGENEKLKLLSSGPGKRESRMKNSRGEDISAEWFEISTKEDDDEWAAFKMVGDMYSDEEEDDLLNEGRLKKKPPPPAKGGGLRGPIGGRRR